MRLTSHEISIVDRISAESRNFTSARWGGPFVPRHSPTAGIFSPGELRGVDAPEELLARVVRELSARGEVRVGLTLKVDGQGASTREFHIEE
ncbi:MAG: hypothetical protein HY815_30355 [Candidatus Riflebacteria bacterium]|nr:hypothetical protein [Candidatus Riflebacteria bacterium]